VTPETLLLVVMLGAALWLVRSRWHVVAAAWAEARWWERVVLVLALLPIPGPVDELAGLLVARRIASRAPALRGR
jgi:hypothetical protein